MPSRYRCAIGCGPAACACGAQTAPTGARRARAWLLGCKLHGLRPLDGRSGNLIGTPGHGDDRAPGWALRDGVEGGVPRGALGEGGQPRAEEGAEEAGRLVLTR